MDLVRTRFYADAVGVFQGGGCRAAAYAGAYAAAKQYGVNFSAVAGTSAGAIAAVLIAAGADPSWLSRQLGSLNFKNFMEPPTRSGRARRVLLPLPQVARQASDLMRYNGLHSARGIESWLDRMFKELLPEVVGRQVTFGDLKLPATVVAADTVTGKARVWGTEVSPEEVVSRSVRASCSIPFFFQPMGPLVDGGLISNLPSFLFDQGSEHPVLAFSLVDDSALRGGPDNVISLIGAVSSAIVRGGQDVQSRLQPHVTTVEIPTHGVRATDFDRLNDDVRKRLERSGFESVERFLKRETVATLSNEPPVRTSYDTETLEIIANEIIAAQREVLICLPDTRWLFELYSAVTIARFKRREVTVVVPHYNGNVEVVLYQRAILRALGCRIQEVPAENPLPIHAVVVDPDRDRRTAIVYSGEGTVHATFLRGRSGDESVISLISGAVRSLIGSGIEGGGAPLGFAPVPEQELIEILQTVDEYRTADLSVESVPLQSVNSWAKYAHSYKQRQQEEMAVLLRESGIDTFEAFSVRYSNGEASVALPPIVEETGDHSFTVVNGLSRLLLLAREGRQDASCLVARNVSAGPPAATRTPLSAVGVKVGRRGAPGHRYDGFVQGSLRHVEAAAHTLALLRTQGGSGDENTNTKRP